MSDLREAICGVLNEQYGCNAEPSEPLVAAVAASLRDEVAQIKQRIEAVADRPGAPKEEQNVASLMIYREHAIAILCGELIDSFWYYGGVDPGLVEA